MKKLDFVVLALLAAVAACNTVEGVGQDMKSAGSAIENTAQKSKPQSQQQQPQ